MSTKFPAAVRRYCNGKKHSKGTSDEYKATVRKWIRWGQDVPLEQLSRSAIRDFLDWVYDQAMEQGGQNPERTSNKARDHIRAVAAWAWENDIIESLPRFPKPRSQRDVAGRQYLSKAELNALYFATYQMRRPHAWKQPHTVGQYWRSAIVLFFNYGLDTGTVWKTKTTHEPLLWRHVFWNHESPDRQSKLRSRYGWIFYRRVKTNKSFYRPMNRVVHAHLRRLQPPKFVPEEPIFAGGTARPNSVFKRLIALAGIRDKVDVETGVAKDWLLKDLRKTCATYYDEHMPESSIEILGHSVSGVTYRHYAHRDPLAFKAIMTIPQPSAFMALPHGIEGECPCCRRRFVGE